MAKEEKYITLKEAAEISGYSPDYIGQLIRSGKLHGKQVYSNVAWMTTETALNDYRSKGKNGAPSSGTIQNSSSESSIVSKLDEKRIGAVYQGALYTLIGAGVVFSLFLFYVLSVNLEKRLEARADQRAQAFEAIDIPLPRDENGDLLSPL